MSDRDDDDRRESRRRRIAEASYDVGYGKPPAANRFRPRNQMAKRRRRHGISSSLADLIRAKGKQKMMLNVGGQQVSMSATRPSYTFFSRTLTRAAKKTSIFGSS